MILIRCILFQQKYDTITTTLFKKKQQKKNEMEKEGELRASSLSTSSSMSKTLEITAEPRPKRLTAFEVSLLFFFLFFFFQQNLLSSSSWQVINILDGMTTDEIEERIQEEETMKTEMDGEISQMRMHEDEDEKEREQKEQKEKEKIHEMNERMKELEEELETEKVKNKTLTEEVEKMHKMCEELIELISKANEAVLHATAEAEKAVDPMRRDEAEAHKQMLLLLAENIRLRKSFPSSSTSTIQPPKT